jgi:tRNA(fMet)-specific endonuclease VapC
MILLDTTFCVDWLRENARMERGPATRKLLELGDASLAISLFTSCELEAGASRSKEPDAERAKLRRFVGHVEVISPGNGFAYLYGELVAALWSSGSMIPLMDILIGLCAKQEGLAVLTRDIGHFSRIPGLTVETY